MPKKRVSKNSKQGISYHIKHKSRLASLLIIKLLLVFLCLGLGIIAYIFISDVLSRIIAAIISLVIVLVLYLFFVIRILRLFKFE